MDFSSGLRKLFGLDPVAARQRQLEQQEQQIVNPVTPNLRQAPIQAGPVQPTGAPIYDAAEQERAQRDLLLRQALEQLRSGQ